MGMGMGMAGANPSNPMLGMGGLFGNNQINIHNNNNLFGMASQPAAAHPMGPPSNPMMDLNNAMLSQSGRPVAAPPQQAMLA